MSAEPKSLEDLRAAAAAAAADLAEAEAEAERRPPKTTAELQAIHDAAVKNLERLEKLRQRREHAKVALVRAQVEMDPDKIAAAEEAHDAAIEAHEGSPITPRDIDVAAQAVLDARAALEEGE